MPKILPRWLKVLVTGEDNQTLEPAYYWTAACLVFGSICTLLGWLFGNPFPIQDFGVFCAAILAAMGAARALDKAAPPPNKE